MRLDWILPLLVPGLALAAQSSPKPRGLPRAAIVCRLEGQATLQDPSGAKRILALYDWLPRGAFVETGAAAKVVLVFAGGERFELAENTRAKVGAKNLHVDMGRAEKKDPLPMIPSMASSIVVSAKGKPGSITVRRLSPPEPWYTGFQPLMDAACLADGAVLSFQPREAGGRFQIQVLDAAGRSLHTESGQATRLTLAPGLLKPGVWYTWRVSASEPERGRPLEARFRTVEAKHAEVRARLQADVDKSSDPASKALLEAMDRWLGLAR